MGEKSRKKKTRKTAVPSSTAGAVASAGVVGGAPVGRGGDADTILPVGTTLALPSSCFHGSNLADFKSPEYAEAMQAYISSFDIRKVGQDSNVKKFFDEHKHLTKHDADFCQFVFAYSTHLYQKYYHLSAKNKMEANSLLQLGIRMRYQDQVQKGVSIDPGSENFDKFNKYNRDIQTERGFIKCLVRETPCNCMDSKKVEAQGMDKTNRCDGCLNHFSKTSLFFCTGCQIGHYCSKACQAKQELDKISLQKNCMMHEQSATTNKGNQNQNNTMTHIHTYIHVYITHFPSLPILFHLASGENTMKEDKEEEEDGERK